MRRAVQAAIYVVLEKYLRIVVRLGEVPQRHGMDFRAHKKGGISALRKLAVQPSRREVRCLAIQVLISIAAENGGAGWPACFVVVFPQPSRRFMPAYPEIA